MSARELRARADPPFVPITGLLADDAVAQQTVDVVMPNAVCAATSLGSVPAANPARRMCCYAIGVAGKLPAAPQAETTDQFGSRSVRLAKQPLMLCEPCSATVLEDGGPDGSEPPCPEGADCTPGEIEPRPGFPLP